jgi:hypothetical protein
MELARIVAVGLALVFGSFAWLASSATAQAPSAEDGYRLLAIDGGVFALGGTSFHGAGGAAACTVRPSPGSGFEPGDYLVCSDIAALPGGGGYWIADRFCHVTAHGRATHHGQRISTRDLLDVFGDCRIAAHPSGQGYWLANDRGQVFAFGEAAHHGDLVGDPGLPGSGVPGDHHAVVDVVATPSGEGYWLVASDGGVFSFGDARFHGSLGGVRLNEPIIGAAASPGGGYWLTALDGGVFAFGPARFHGSMGGVRLNAPVWGIDPSPSGNGYLLVATDGGVFAFGDARFGGSMGGTRLNAPVVAITVGP